MSTPRSFILGARSRLALPLFGALAILAGCAFMQQGEVKLVGRALLQGQSNHSGTTVVLDGIDSTFTNSNGDYEFSGYANGEDHFSVIIRHDGYGTMQITGTISFDSSSDAAVTTNLGTVTLPDWSR